ncbi:unnamed protein product [Clavelina lepadiformis]|uniref:Uncharacterized protein n=1 Tax=Clavelina lepadiformis TaxID=159417 RepID=A0ABP0FQW7_CLALP
MTSQHKFLIQDMRYHGGTFYVLIFQNANDIPCLNVFYGARRQPRLPTLLKLVLDDSVVKYKGGFFNTWHHEEWLPHATDESAWEPLMRKSLEVTGLSSP